MSGARKAGGTGRACIGLGLAGQGLAILSGVVPHEDPLVGLGLLVFGCVLTATGTLPRFPSIRTWHLAALGVFMLAAVAASWAWTRHAPGGPMILLATLGVAMLAAGTTTRLRFQVGKRYLNLRDLAPGLAVAVGVPILVWSVQAFFKRISGITPVESLEVAFLVVPVHVLLGWFGLPSTMAGQTLTLAGPTGLMSVEIGAACSGIQAMALFLGVVALFAAVERPASRRLAAWTAIGLAGVYVANVIRLIVIVFAGHWWGPEALERVHANAGWVFFVAWSLLFSLWVRRDLRVRATSRAPPVLPK